MQNLVYELPLGFLSRSPSSRREWLSLRLLQVSRSLERTFGLPCASIELEGVPQAVASEACPESRPGPSWDWTLPGELWSRHGAGFSDPTFPLEVLTSGGGRCVLTRSLPQQSGPALAATLHWGPVWEGDWSAGAGAVERFWVHLQPTGFTPAQVEVLETLYSDGASAALAFRTALVVV